MKKYFTTPFKILVTLVSAFLFAGCVKDTCKHSYTYTYYQPLYKTSEEVRANIKSNPATEIKNAGKIVILGNYIFLNEIDKGIHIIDNSNPSTPINASFIDIPGNVDLAVKGNTLYADLYTDLVALDISNPLNVKKIKIVDNAFPQRYYGYGFSADKSKIIYDWIKHDTTIISNCSSTGWSGRGGIFLYSANPAGLSNNIASPATVGIAGSMSRFALVDNYLYAVDNDGINTFDISNNNPTFSNKVQADWHIETIYPFKNKLFIGSNNGMFIYDIQSAPGKPVKVGTFTHTRACDPVIADDNFAYVTLHSGTTCLGFNNQLDVIQLNNLTNATLAKTYSLTSPYGLSKDGKLLFICDGNDGLKVYDASDVLNLKLIKQINGIETYDVIAFNGIALVVSKDGLYQYNYSNINNIHMLSKIGISK